MFWALDNPKYGALQPWEDPSSYSAAACRCYFSGDRVLTRKRRAQPSVRLLDDEAELAVFTVWRQSEVGKRLFRPCCTNYRSLGIRLSIVAALRSHGRVPWRCALPARSLDRGHANALASPQIVFDADPYMDP